MNLEDTCSILSVDIAVINQKLDVVLEAIKKIQIAEELTDSRITKLEHSNTRIKTVAGVLIASIGFLLWVSDSYITQLTERQLNEADIYYLLCKQRRGSSPAIANRLTEICE